MNATSNQAILLGNDTIVCIDAIFCCRGNPTTFEIHVDFGGTNNKTLTHTVKCQDADCYVNAMAYLFKAINHKCDAVTEHEWADWEENTKKMKVAVKVSEEKADSTDDDDFDEDQVIRVPPKNPLPEYICVGTAVVARTSNKWELVKVTNIIPGTPPTIVVASKSQGMATKIEYHPDQFHQIREDRHSSRTASRCREWLNQPVLYLPQMNTYLLQRGWVRGASMSVGDSKGLLIQPDGSDECDEVPIKDVYVLL